MRRTKTWQWMVGCLIIVFGATGCFQEAGSGAIDSTPIAQALPSATPTFTLVPPSATPVPTEDATQTPTQIPSPTEVVIEFPTETEEPVSVAQAATPNELEARATVLVQTATGEAAIRFTLTAQALGIGGPTATPFPTITPELFVPTQDTGTINQPVIPGTDCVHEVRAGENLFRLSLTYGVLVRDIANRSGVTNINLISIGQKLTIPGCGTTGVFPPPTSIPTTAFDGTTAQGGTGTQPISQVITHLVEQGENLFQLSLRYGVTVQEIANYNGITNINYIVMGETLEIPIR